MVRVFIELTTRLGLEWYLGLGCGPLYQYSEGVQTEIFPHIS